MDNMVTTPIKKSKWPKRIAIFCLSVIILFIIYVLICGMTYSKDSRTGIVVKLSQKGYLFKTYEGEMNLDEMTADEVTLLPTKVWNFSIQKNDTAVFNAISRSQGQQVHLFYDQVLKSFFWQGETKYFVTKVVPI